MVIFLFQASYYFPEKKFPPGGGIHDHFRGRQVQGRRQHIHPVQPRERLQLQGSVLHDFLQHTLEHDILGKTCHFLPERRHRRVRLRVRIYDTYLLSVQPCDTGRQIQQRSGLCHTALVVYTCCRNCFHDLSISLIITM